MYKKNESFVANRVDTGTKWIFTTLSDADPTANVEESLSLVAQLFAAFDGLVYPTTAEYVLFVPESNLDEYVSVTGELESVTGLTAEDVADEFLNRSDSERGTFRRLTINQNKTRIELEDGEHLIDVSSDRYRPWTGDERVEQPPAEDVFRIDVFYDDGSSTKSSYYEIVIWTYTDIWFEDTEIGARNRERLATALGQFYDAVDAESVDFESRLVSKDSLQSEGFSDLLPDRTGE